ncbi:CLUMA_CG005178, isoform A [Clunio marinus]|uniref:CLUMA_CG005178, isoform A n=1 Tax=Clunio marinus TaxID=568069 RepID=A0A1J1HU39_9DIPT|nr:CLUMA_CG005178, isoform A [Clunio marinus]
MSDKVVEFINHYRKSIERHCEDPERILHCLTRLEKLKVNVGHLQQTGIGKTVNAVRKHEGEVGDLAKKLVMRWKDMVSEAEAAEKSKTQAPLFKLPIKLSPDEHKPAIVFQEDKKQKYTTHFSDGFKVKLDQPHHSSSRYKSEDAEHNDKKSSERHHKSHHSSSSSSHKESSSKRKHEDTFTESKENETSKKKPKLEKENDKKESSSSSKSSNHSSKSNSNSSSKSKDKSTRKHDNDKKIDEELDGSQGIGFAEALALFDMPSTSKKKDVPLADKIVTVKTKPPSKKVSKPEIKSTKPPQTSSSTSLGRKEQVKVALKLLTSPPEILIQKPDLGPLPDIVTDLPSDVSIPDYRPMPLSSAVKDYINSSVHGTSSNSNYRNQHKQMSDTDLLAESFSSKANRTRVFSGNRVQKSVPTLFEMCIRILQENIEFLTETGGVPFDILRPVLEKAKPEQLCNIEYYNPYLLDDSDVLWEPHCKRKFRTKKRLEMESWRDMYERCTREDEEKLNRLTQNIKQHQEHTSNGVQKTLLAYVDTIAKAPRSVMKKQEIYGTNRKMVASPAARTEGLRHLAPNIAAPGDARLRVAAGIRDDAQNFGRGFQRPTKKAPLMAKVLSKFKR